jgi:hypothetical protein
MTNQSPNCSFNQSLHTIVKKNKDNFFLVEETYLLFLFLQHSIPKDLQYEFPDIDLHNEVTSFLLSFSKESYIRIFSCQMCSSHHEISHLLIRSTVVENRVCFQTQLRSIYHDIVLCEFLGYKDTFRLFKTKEDVLEECIRLQTIFVQSSLHTLEKCLGECSVCYTEGTLLEWPCHKSHVICEECTNKIIKQKSLCPICRTFLDTTSINTIMLIENDDVIEDEEHYYSTKFVEQKRISKRRNDGFIR